MTQFLPANLLALFAARDPIPYLQPPDKLPHEKKTRGYSGVGSFLGFFEVSKVKFEKLSGSQKKNLCSSGSQRYTTTN